MATSSSTKRISGMHKFMHTLPKTFQGLAWRQRDTCPHLCMRKSVTHSRCTSTRTHKHNLMIRIKRSKSLSMPNQTSTKLKHYGSQTPRIKRITADGPTKFPAIGILGPTQFLGDSIVHSNHAERAHLSWSQFRSNP